MAAEGVVGAYLAHDGKLAAMVEVNCETDFVSRNEDFVAFAKELARLVAEKNPADVAALAALPLRGGTVESVRQALVQKIGENMSIRRFVRFTTPARARAVPAWRRPRRRDGGIRRRRRCGRQGRRDAYRGVASPNIRPVCVSRDQVPADLIEKERAIYTAQAADSGKPADIVAKMVEGRVNKFLAEITLLGQPFVKNPDDTVEKHLKAKGATVKSFALYVVGEGIEKKKDDFAAEVAAMAKAVGRQYPGGAKGPDRGSRARD